MKDTPNKRKYIFRFLVKPQKENYVVNRRQFQLADERYRPLVESLDHRIKQTKH